MPEGNTQTVKFADKYDSPEALENGIKEVRKTLGMPDLGTMKIYGDGGLYKDVTAAERGYKDLESMIGKMKPPASTVTTETKIDPNAKAGGELKITPASGDDVDIESLLKKAGVTPEAVVEEWTKNGKLTDEQYAAFKDNAKIGRKLVDTMMAGQMATAALNQQNMAATKANATKLAGGDQQLSNLLQFGNSLPENRIKDINARLQNPAQMEGAIKELLYEHTQAMRAGNARPLIEGDAGANVSAGKAKNLKEFKELTRKVNAGDAGAIAVMSSMTNDEIQRLM